MAGGTSLRPPSFLQTSLPSCSPLAGKAQGRGRDHPLPRFAPAESGARAGRLALWASRPRLGDEGSEQRPPTTGTLRIPWVELSGDKPGRQTFQGLQVGQEEPFPLTHLGAEPRCPAALTWPPRTLGTAPFSSTSRGAPLWVGRASPSSRQTQQKSEWKMPRLRGF